MSDRQRKILFQIITVVCLLMPNVFCQAALRSGLFAGQVPPGSTDDRQFIFIAPTDGRIQMIQFTNNHYRREPLKGIEWAEDKNSFLHRQDGQTLQFVFNGDDVLSCDLCEQQNKPRRWKKVSNPVVLQSPPKMYSPQWNNGLAPKNHTKIKERITLMLGRHTCGVRISQYASDGTKIKTKGYRCRSRVFGSILEVSFGKDESATQYEFLQLDDGKLLYSGSGEDEAMKYWNPFDWNE